MTLHSTKSAIFRSTAYFLFLFAFGAAQAQYTQIDNLKAATDLVDARGFRSQGSNAVIDGKLIVSNANGNVSYHYPISERTIDGYPVKAELNYCGSVSFTAYRDFDGPTRRWSKFSQNKPAWIIGVNGFAVQVIASTMRFNMSKVEALKPVTPPNPPYPDVDVKTWTIDGYDVCNRMEDLKYYPEQIAKKPVDYIRLLRSDGSILELANPSNISNINMIDTASRLYTGRYFENGPNSQGFALVEYDTNSQYPPLPGPVVNINGTNYREGGSNYPDWLKIQIAFYGQPHARFIPRRVRYYPGDGLEYIFREWIIPYGTQYMFSRNCNPTNRYGSLGAFPTVFYLEEIRSPNKPITKFFRSRHFPTPADSTVGRALCTGFTDHTIIYSDMLLTIEALGRTTNVRFDSNVRFDEREKLAWMDRTPDGGGHSNESTLGMVTSIIDPDAKSYFFDYETYRRRYEGFGWPWGEPGGTNLAGTSATLVTKAKRLVGIYDPYAATQQKVSYYGDTVRLIRQDSPLGAPKQSLYVTNNMAKKVEKYISRMKGQNDGNLTEQNFTYAFAPPDPTTYDSSFISLCEVTVTDKRTNLSETNRFYYQKHNISAGSGIAPSRFTALWRQEHITTGRSVQTTTRYAKPYPATEFLWKPDMKKVVISENGWNLTESLSKYSYETEQVRSYNWWRPDVDTVFGQAITKETEQLFRNGDTSRLYLTNVTEYQNLKHVDSTFTVYYREWKKMQIRENFIKLLAQGVKIDWVEAVLTNDPRLIDPIKDYYVTSETRKLYANPFYSLPRKVVSYDSSGIILGGKVNVYQTVCGSGTWPRGAVMRDSVIGYGGVRLLNKSYEFSPFTNLLHKTSSVTGAVSKNFYNEWALEAEHLPDGKIATNLGFTRTKKIFNPGYLLGYGDFPAAEQSIVRKYNTSGTVDTVKLTTQYERTYYGLPISVTDPNGWYSRYEYDLTGRMTAAWLPLDFPNDTLITRLKEGWRTLGIDQGVVGYSKGIRHYSKMYCPGDGTWYEHSDYFTGYDAMRSGTKILSPNTSYDCNSLPAPIMAGGERPDNSKADNSKPDNSKPDKSRSQMLEITPTYKEYFSWNSDDRTALVMLPQQSNISRVDSALLRLFIANVDAACVEVRFTIDSIGFQQIYVFNCPPANYGNTSGGNNLSPQVDTVYHGASPGKFMYLDLNDPTVLSALSSRIRGGKNTLCRIEVLTADASITFTTDAEDKAPALLLKGSFAEPEPVDDYTARWEHIDPRRSIVFPKIDDEFRRSNKGIAVAGDLYNRRIGATTNFLGADYFLEKTETRIGAPGSTAVQRTSYSNNGFGAAIAVTDPLNFTRTTVTDALRRPVTITDEEQQSVQISYTSGEQYADFNISLTDQDFFGRCEVKTTTDENGTVSREYTDAFAQVRRQVTDFGSGKLNLTTRYEYDNQGRLIRVLNPKGDTTRYWYDRFGRVQYKRQADLGLISYAYDKAGNVRFVQTQSQADSSSITYYEYDDLNRPLVVGEGSVSLPLDYAVGPEWTPAYAWSGRDSLSMNRLTDILTPTLLQLGGGISSILTSNKTLWQGSPQKFLWDGGSLDTSSCLPTDRGEFAGESAGGAALKHKAVYYWLQPLAPTSVFACENIATNPHFVRNAVWYDSLPPVAGAVWGGMPQHSQWAALAPHGIIRNQKGHEAAVAYREQANQPYHYTMMSYDERGRVEAILRYNENLGFDAVYYTYNSVNLVTSVRVADALRTYTTWYGYDYNGRVDSVWSELKNGGLGVTSPAFPAADTIQVRNNNVLAHVLNCGVGNVPPKRTAANPDIVYSYDGRSQVSTMAYPKVNTVTSYQYTPRRFLDRMEALKNGTRLFVQKLYYDYHGLISSQESAHGAGTFPSTQNYFYDNADRLTEFMYYESLKAPREELYSYDNVGNRISQTVKLYPAGQPPQILSAASYLYMDLQGPDRLTKRMSTSQTAEYSYTPDGAMKGRVLTDASNGYFRVRQERFRYNFKGLLTELGTTGEVYGQGGVCPEQLEGAMQLWKYAYAAFGEREQKRLYPALNKPVEVQKALTWTYYQLGAHKEQLAVYHGVEGKTACDTTKAMVYMYPSEYITYGMTTTSNFATKANSSVEYYIKDHLGSTRVVIASNGTLTKQMDFEPFGSILWQNGSANPTKVYIDRPKDKESGLHNFGVRSFIDDGGRFSSIDPLWEKHYSRSPYHYCMNSPLSYHDPSGLDSAQRAAAIDKAKEYLGSGSTYKMGAKGQPGQPVDCSGLVSHAVKAGGEPNPNRGKGSSGVLLIEKNTKKVETNDVQAGNIVTFRTGGNWSYHTGLVTSVTKDNSGNVTQVGFIHSNSRSNGPSEGTLIIGSNKGLSDNINGFYKWDTKPDGQGTQAVTPSPAMPARYHDVENEYPD